MWHGIATGGKLTSCGGRLAGVDVADNDDVDMSLLLTARRQSMLLSSEGCPYPILAVVVCCLLEVVEVAED